MKIPSEVPGCARIGAGEKPGSVFSTRTIAPGNLTFHTARLSVSPRKPFPDENQSGEPSKLPDNRVDQTKVRWRAAPLT